MDPSPAVRPTVGVQSGRISMTHKNGAKPKRQIRQYGAPERLGYMLLALQTSSEQVARDHGIPPGTLRTWFADAGTGLNECRRWLEAEVLGSYLRSRQAIFNEVMARTPKLHEKELMETYRKLVGQEETPQGANAGAAAAAQAVSEVRVIVEDNRG